jgi:hypothetical protein
MAEMTRNVMVGRTIVSQNTAKPGLFLNTFRNSSTLHSMCLNQTIQLEKVEWLLLLSEKDKHPDEQFSYLGDKESPIRLY